MNIAVAVGIIFLAGAAGGKLARLTKLPSVTGNLIGGIVVGPSVLGILPQDVLYDLTPINDLALGIIALSIGAELQWKRVKRLVGDVSKIFLTEGLITLFVVFGSLYLVGLPFSQALILGIISVATAPGAIMACIKENPSKEGFNKVLLSVVAVDNLFAISLFGIAVSLLQATIGNLEANGTPLWIMVSRDITFSLIIGLIAGAFLVITAKWAKKDGHILVSVLGGILVTVGVANMLDIPALLAAIIAGIIYTNFTRRPQRISRSLFPIEDTVLLAFFTLAGTKLDVAVLPVVGLIGVVYIVARFLSKVIGTRIGSTFTTFPVSWKVNLGRALTPHGGVAIGLSVLAEQKDIFPPDTIMPVILAAVVFFEFVGPILVNKVLCTVE
ncbi:transporter, CPA2 family [Pelagirhabdus alkalitolerans]|uniref:Transporter, CPA2 family n=1 Tax=Pelagirhabdus alkalitolerans TaxID=1612202 RepID=A0A1G6L342_9BACI|nr:cation:proton antiporter [Pelagirhabdus alkalitolerans]SDC37553.1 transporter, CPA2 family [Pelagirhabdus alkalitolerans]